MIMFILSRILSAWFAFILPSFATFKALSRRPLSESDLHKLSTYWAVVGIFVAFEYLAEWLISWLPFYWELKTLFLLFLSLPQTQGSTYIYNTYLHPIFIRNEANFDAGIVAIQSNVLAFIQERLTTLWNVLWNLSTRIQAQGQSSAQPSSQCQEQQPPKLHTLWEITPARGGSHTSLASENGSTQNVPSFPTPQHYE